MNKRKLFQIRKFNNKNETKKKQFYLRNLTNNTFSQKLNKETGITLIALVISIIVMLILAGVSLNATIRR